MIKKKQIGPTGNSSACHWKNNELIRLRFTWSTNFLGAGFIYLVEINLENWLRHWITLQESIYLRMARKWIYNGCLWEYLVSYCCEKKKLNKFPILKLFTDQSEVIFFCRVWTCKVLCVCLSDCVFVHPSHFVLSIMY